MLYSLPWLFPVFVFYFRRNTGVPWHTSGQALALSVAQVQSLVQELRSHKLCGAARSKQQQHVQVCTVLSVRGRERVRQYSVIVSPVCAADFSVYVSWKRSVKFSKQVQCNSCTFREVFSSKRHFKMLQAFPVLEMGLKTMLQKIPLAATPDE